MERIIDGHKCFQVQPSTHLELRARRWIQGRSSRDRPGYWVKLTKRIYASVEHTGDITFWRE